MNIEKIRRKARYFPQTTLRNGIKLTIDWVLNHPEYWENN
jgi:dTDP-D-glucose 4,6-dehydratase